MFRIIDLIIRLNFKLTELTFRFALAVVEALIGVVKGRKRADPVQPATPVAPVYPSAPQNIPEPAPTVVKAAQEAQTPTPQSVAAVLAKPDRQIYYLVGDHVQRHPHSEALDDMVTRMAFTAMHRDGEPFEMTPELDKSGPAVGPFAVPPHMPDPDPSAGLSFPPQDGAVYVLRGGKITPQSAWH
jgi:hypothetical protein